MASPQAPCVPGDPAHLYDLVSVILGSVNDIVSEYSVAGASVIPLDSASTEDGPFDAPENMSPKLVDAVRLVEAACAQLVATVASPGLTLVNKGFAYEETACLQVAIRSQIADHLHGKPGGVPVEELAKTIGIDADRLTRVMRLLTTKNVFSEVAPKVFANNRLSMKLLSGNTTRDFLELITYDCFKPAPVLHEALTDKSPTAPQAPYERFHGISMFGHMNTPGGEAMASRFAKAMIGWGDLTGRNLLPIVYPWSALPTSSSPITVCDVGGGTGHATLALMRAYPEIPFNIVVQDLPSMTEQGKELWKKEAPEFVSSGRVEFVPIDFFKSAPVGGCDFYNIRHILHNWSDDACAKLLTNVASAMREKAGSRLLINDIAIKPSPSAPTPGSKYTPAHPGVPRVLDLDVNMLVLLGDAKERTVAEFVELGKKAGLAFVNVYDTGPTFESILEFTLA